MAERRMLSRKITNHDNFTSLPATSQALYMHLVMGADDDGFCDQINTAMFRAHAKPKDLEALINSKYLLRFENGVVVIKHWRMANAGRSDRYTPTAYQEEFRRLTIKPNKAYTLAPLGNADDSQMDTNWQPDGNQPHTQKRREENRREDNSVYEARMPERRDEKDDLFSAFWEAYPKKNGGDIREAFMEYRHVTEDLGVPPQELEKAALNLASTVEPQDIRYLPNAAKWLRNRGWLTPVAKKKPEGKPKQYTTAEEYEAPSKIDASKLESLKKMTEDWKK